MPVETHQPQRTQPTGSRFAKELRGFGPPGIFAIGTVLLTGTITIQQIAIPLGAVLVLLWVRLSCTPWHEIGYVRPRSWGRTIAAGIIFGFTFKLLTKAVIMPLLGAGPVNFVFHYLSGNSAALPAAIWMMLVTGFAEETVFRGFLFERMGKILGRRWWTKAVTVIVTSLWFGFAHMPVQGFMGGVHATILGLTFGTIYAFTGRIFLLMIAHAVYNLTALSLIYWNLEAGVAQFFFR